MLTFQWSVNLAEIILIQDGVLVLEQKKLAPLQKCKSNKCDKNLILSFFLFQDIEKTMISITDVNFFYQVRK